MKKNFSIFCSVLFLTCLVAAAEEKPTTAVSSASTAVPTAEGRKKEPKPRKSRPAQTFSPSEKIGADTVVAFPVDI